MKEYILKSTIFLLILGVLVHVYPIYLIITNKYEETVAGSSNYHSIEKSKKKTKSKIVVFGDSVGRQLFDNYKHNDSINSLACNMGISIVGQYILLKNYFDAGNQPDKVVLICTPFTFKNNLNNKFTYHYFLKPFYKKKYYKYFTKTVKEQIKKIPYYWLCQTPIPLTNNWGPAVETTDLKDTNVFLSAISSEYIRKMGQLSKSHGTDFIILPTPTRESYRSNVKKLDTTQIYTEGLITEFQYFFENLTYINDTCFIDDVHLKNPQYFFSAYIQNISNP